MSTELHRSVLVGRRFEVARCGGCWTVPLVRWVAALVVDFNLGAVRRDTVWSLVGVRRAVTAARSWLCSGVVSVRSWLSGTSFQCGGWLSCSARSGFLFGGPSPSVAGLNWIRPNNALEADAVNRRQLWRVLSRRAAQSRCSMAEDGKGVGISAQGN